MGKWIFYCQVKSNLRPLLERCEGMTTQLSLVPRDSRLVLSVLTSYGGLLNTIISITSRNHFSSTAEEKIIDQIVLLNPLKTYLRLIIGHALDLSTYQVMQGCTLFKHPINLRWSTLDARDGKCR